VALLSERLFYPPAPRWPAAHRLHSNRFYRALSDARNDVQYVNSTEINHRASERLLLSDIGILLPRTTSIIEDCFKMQPDYLETD
jgi:hypothetical protein